MTARATTAPLRSVDDHIATLLRLGEPLPAVDRPVGACRGWVLAHDVAALLPVPPFDNSAMDGFALRAADLGGLPDDGLVLPVAGDTPAGAAPNPLPPGQAQRIMTGAPIPVGADTVVPVELTDHAPGPHDLPPTVHLMERPVVGRHIRRRGEDLQAGDPVLAAGTRLGPAHLAAAISTGHATLRVHSRPRVAVLSTGDELTDPAPSLRPGLIPDSNGPLLAALAEEAGAQVVELRRAPDTVEAFETALREVLVRADLVITTGGVSAGAFEVVKQSLGSGGAVSFTRLAMQPGKPQGWGRLDDGTGRLVPLVALPGNPVSSFVSFHALVRPLVARLAGAAPADQRRTLPAVAGEEWASPSGKRQFVPVTLTRTDTGYVAQRSHRLGSGSHLIGSLHLADGLAVVPEETSTVAVGDRLEVLPTRAGMVP